MAPWGKSVHKIMNHQQALFGLSSRKNLLLETRGGSTKAAEADDEAQTEEEAPVELYLPGLLDAVVSSPDMVCRFVGLDTAL